LKRKKVHVREGKLRCQGGRIGSEVEEKRTLTWKGKRKGKQGRPIKEALPGPGGLRIQKKKKVGGEKFSTGV